jgi:hypothetical protein
LTAVLTLVVVCVAAFLLTRLSLDNVPGVTRRPNGSCCNTDFVNGNWWRAFLVLAIPIWVAARTYWWAGLLTLAVPTYATFYIANTTTNRYTDSGWGDGLEIFTYVGSVVHLIAFLVAYGYGSLAYRRRRQRQALAAAH